MDMVAPPVERLCPRIDGILRIRNFYWAGPVFRPVIEPGEGRAWLNALGATRGQFALVLDDVATGTITLARDPLGTNKLFFALHRSGPLSAANYLIDLIKRGVPCEAVYSVPPGCALRMDLERGSLALSRYFSIGRRGSRRSLGDIARTAREQLETWFARLAVQFRDRRACVCLSGGLDSGVIAAFARRYFPDLVAYTYSYARGRDGESEDASSARRLTGALGIPIRVVTATADDVLEAVGSALAGAQDWRDFNVHCAIVNELLARAIKRDLGDTADGGTPLVFTGDLSNEFHADYTPVVYDGREYYSLPKIDRGSLRRVLIRGLDAGDREIGVFGRHALDVIQPYGLLADALLDIPASLLNEPDTKQRLARQIAGDLLPDWIFSRPKVRAQIGNAQCVTGILPTLVDHGRDSVWLRQAFRDTFGIEDAGFFSRFIRAGAYRPLHRFPKRIGKGDYLIG